MFTSDTDANTQMRRKHEDKYIMNVEFKPNAAVISFVNLQKK